MDPPQQHLPCCPSEQSWLPQQHLQQAIGVSLWFSACRAAERTPGALAGVLAGWHLSREGEKSLLGTKAGREFGRMGNEVKRRGFKSLRKATRRRHGWWESGKVGIGRESDMWGLEG